MKHLSRYPLWLLCAITITTALFSCQKSADDTLPEDTTAVSSKDPKALSAAITVWHGKRTTGTLPVPSSTSEIRLGTSNEPSVTAIAGRHAFIHTSVESGDVAGYYVQINGASDYFIVDYTKPVNVQNNTQQGSISTASVHQFGHAAEPTIQHRSPISVMGTGDNFNDSIIVINIPANIKTPDTVCVTYMAYDFNNHVSNSVTTCIYIDHLGSDNDSKWLEGTWNLSRIEKLQGSQLLRSYNFVYNKWVTKGNDELLDNDNVASKVYKSGDSVVVTSAFWNNYYVVTPTNTYQVDVPYTPRMNDVVLGTDSIIFRKDYVTLSSNGTYVSEYYVTTKTIFWNDKISFDEFSDYFLDNGAWSYDSKTKKVIVVNEYTDHGRGAGPQLDPYLSEAPIEKISNDQWKISYDEEGNDGKIYTYTSTYKRQ
ncbi:hypothetical protein QEG73_15545 [Chitinophagaceae bacterium 26-R-25]|nr:hypothetical protein [Chitinophagaceae bacterium 26-R-25]